MYWKSNYTLGTHCHWCGALVPDDGKVKTGNHLYCRNGGKCKMAHARAFAKYKAKVTPGEISPRGLVSSPGPSGHAKRSAAMVTSSDEISPAAATKSNEAKRARALKSSVPRADTGSAGLSISRKHKVKRISARL